MRIPMPWSVRIAAGGLVLAVAVQVALVVTFGAARDVGWFRPGLALAVLGLLLAGLLRASRLAWLWGRHLGFLLAGAVLVGLVLQARSDGVPAAAAALLMGGIAAPLATVSVALGRRSAFEWFGLVCPSCGASTGRGDLLMWTARCRQCGTGF
jgi:hypothetical protein